MNLFDHFHNFDRLLLQFFNSGSAHPWNDQVFKFWSSEAPWFVVAGLFFLQTAYRRQWATLKAFLWMAATLGVTDVTASQVLKPWIGRLRPCKSEDWIRIVDGCAGSFSFPSNHASNGAAFAMFWFFWMGPRAGLLALGCVLCVGLSRVYLGVHYPSDILGGFGFGGLIGAMSYAIYRQTLGDAKKGAQGPPTPSLNKG